MLLEKQSKASITGGQIHKEQVRNRRPGESRVFEAHGFPSDHHRVELDDEVGAGIIDGKESPAARPDPYTQRFCQFPVCGCLERFPRFQFTAGELPKPPMALMGGAVADELMAVAFNHGCYDANFLHIAHWCLPVQSRLTGLLSQFQFIQVVCPSLHHHPALRKVGHSVVTQNPFRGPTLEPDDTDQARASASFRVRANRSGFFSASPMAPALP